MISQLCDIRVWHLSPFLGLEPVQLTSSVMDGTPRFLVRPTSPAVTSRPNLSSWWQTKIPTICPRLIHSSPRPVIASCLFCRFCAGAEDDVTTDEHRGSIAVACYDGFVQYLALAKSIQYGKEWKKIICSEFLAVMIPVVQPYRTLERGQGARK